MNKIQWTLAIATSGLIPFALGCGSGGSPTAGTPDDSTPAAAQVAAETPQAGSSVTIVEQGVETEAAQCVAIFLDSLRRGDERAANGVLTAKSREELAKTAYVVQPLGTPQGQYQIGRVGFPYEDKTVALVECTWTEPPADGQEQVSMDIVCEVHQEPEGWRISGIGVSIPNTDETLVLDFEDAAALQATIDAATGQAAAQAPPASAQVAAPPAQMAPPATPGPTGLPSYPNAGGDIQVDDAAPPQIALPPQYDGSVKR